MASNSFGERFRITTWGESHGKAIGVVIDGCPAGITLSVDEINQELKKRAPGNHPLTSQRKEPDLVEIWSGLFEGKTTGAPLSLILFNRDCNPAAYEPIKELIRPGHANYTWLQKYGVYDWQGGGRASARETACRVAAGVVAKKVLEPHGIHCLAELIEVGGQPIEKMEETIKKAKDAGDSVGGLVGLTITGVPPGIGDPVYRKLPAVLSFALMSIPAVKGVEVGSGFQSAAMRGSEHNDLMSEDFSFLSNNAGGVLGGVSTGEPICFKVAFKPTSSILKPQETVTLKGNQATLTLPKGSRHDPCVALRAPPIVEAMAALVVADFMT